MFGLSLVCYDVVLFVFVVATLDLCRDDSDKENIFDQIKLW